MISFQWLPNVKQIDITISKDNKIILYPNGSISYIGSLANSLGHVNRYYEIDPLAMLSKNYNEALGITLTISTVLNK